MLSASFTATIITSILFAGGVLSQQCYRQPNCVGDSLVVSSAKECCVGTDDGMSYAESSGACVVSQCIVHGFDNPSYNVEEGERLDISFEPNVKGKTNFSALIISGYITTEPSGTARTTDFEALQPIQLSDSKAIIRLFTSNDMIALEYEDTVTLAFIPSHPNFTQLIEDAGEFIRDNVTVNIIDNDQLCIHIEEDCYTIREGQTQDLIVQLQFGMTQNPFNMTLFLVSITEAIDLTGFNVSAFITSEDVEATPGTDFTNTSFTITVPASEDTVGQLIIPLLSDVLVIDDDINEMCKSFALVTQIESDVPENFTCFQKSHFSPCCCFNDTESLGINGAARIKIVDNDDMKIGFYERNQTILESDVVLSLRVHSLRLSELDYEVLFSLLDKNGSNAEIESPFFPLHDEFDVKFGSREDPSDPNDPLEFCSVLHSGNLELTVLLQVHVINESIVESEECFTIAITSSPDNVESFTCNDDKHNATDFFCLHTICIEDGDDLNTSYPRPEHYASAVVAFVKTMYTVLESEGHVEICINVTSSKDIDDVIIHLDVFDFSRSIYIPSNVTLGTPDPPHPLFGTYGMIPMSDYEQQVLGINRIRNTTINTTRKVVCYNQTIYDDVFLETSEYMGLTLAIGFSTIITTIQPMYDQAAILILDDDIVIVSLEDILYQCNEEDGFVEVCVIVRSPAVECPVSFSFDVRLFTVENTAVSGLDYVGLDVTITFGACDTRKCVNIRIIDDHNVEKAEYFLIKLIRTLGLSEAVTLSQTNAQIWIYSEDEARVGFQFIAYSTKENGNPVRVCVKVTGEDTFCPISFDFRLSLSTLDGSAVAPHDYVSIGISLVFLACQKEKCASVIINDDERVEELESFYLTLERIPGVNGHVILEPNKTKITIEDNDKPSVVVAFVRTVYVVFESEGQVEVCVNVTSSKNIENGTIRLEVFDYSRSVYIPSNVNLATPDRPHPLSGTYAMIPMSDYEQQVFGFNRIRNTVITSSTKLVCYNQTIYDDIYLETSEYMGLTLAVRSSTTIVTTVQPMYDQAAILIISDDIAVVGLKKTLYRVSETDGAVEVCVVVSSPSIKCPISFPFEVRLRTLNYEAESGLDYLSFDDIIHFNQCDICKCVIICLIDDLIVEKVEQFNIQLTMNTSDLSDIIELDPMNASVQIYDIIVGLKLPDTGFYLVGEDEGVVEVCAVVFTSNTTCLIPFPFQIEIYTRDYNSADAPTDFIAIATTLSFAACETRKCVNVTIIDDSVQELIESFALTLAGASGLTRSIMLHPVDAYVLIYDND